MIKCFYLSLFVFIQLSFGQITYIKITDSDLERFGSWPIDRMWLAYTIDKLNKLNTENIYLNIAFKELNPKTYEADRYLLKSINDANNLYLLESQLVNTTANNLPVLSDIIELKNQKIYINKDSLFSHRNIQYKFIPLDNDTVDYFSLSEFLDDGFVNLEKNVFIGADINGVTSQLINTENNQPYSVSDIYYQLIQQLSFNNLKTDISNIYYLFICSLILMTFYFRRSKLRFWVIVTALELIILSSFILYQFELTSILMYIFIKLCLLLFVYKMRYQKDQEASNLQIEQLTSDKIDLSNEIEKYAVSKVSIPIENNHGILYHESSPIKQILSKLQKISQSEISVILLGETGTGKELFARFIHETSARSKGPLISINCASIPQNLVESELFGHEKGSFTSADRQKMA